jgi:hypothetical protein
MTRYNKKGELPRFTDEDALDETMYEHSQRQPVWSNLPDIAKQQWIEWQAMEKLYGYDSGQILPKVENVRNKK